MIKVLIADDHVQVRLRMKSLIEKSADIKVEGEAESGTEVLNKAICDNFDIVLLDISLPGKNGLEVLKNLKIRQPDLQVIMLSIYSEEEYVIRALKFGADGYVAKADAPGELVKAIRKVLRGKIYLSSSLTSIWAFSQEAEQKNHPCGTLFPTAYAGLCA